MPKHRPDDGDNRRGSPDTGKPSRRYELPDARWRLLPDHSDRCLQDGNARETHPTDARCGRLGLHHLSVPDRIDFPIVLAANHGGWFADSTRRRRGCDRLLELYDGNEPGRGQRVCLKAGIVTHIH